MNFFEAVRIERKFREYRDLAIAYWAAVEPIEYGAHGWMAGPDAPTHRENEESRKLRRELVMREPEVILFASKLGVGVTGQSFPAPAVGGPVLPFNLLAHVIDQNVGHRHVDRQMVLDAIDRCIGAAGVIKRRIGFRLLKPWCWLVDIPALIVAWPFRIMHRAGVPDSIVESGIAQVTKTVLASLLSIGTFAYAVYKVGLLAALASLLAG